MSGFGHLTTEYILLSYKCQPPLYNIRMLLDTRKKTAETKEGFNPNVQNDIVEAGAPTGGLVLFIILSVITLCIFTACA
ncbi:MAG: hypothetical protein LBB45_04460 [Methanobrevibacter sp.]|jgi:hypothetical protein|nr:hypothetical protein [Candidatus Methanovirga basalitermitum]